MNFLAKWKKMTFSCALQGLFQNYVKFQKKHVFTISGTHTWPTSSDQTKLTELMYVSHGFFERSQLLTLLVQWKGKG